MRTTLAGIFALALLAPLLLGAGGNPQVTNVTIHEYGIFESDIGEAMSPGGQGNQEQVLAMSNEQLVEQTDRIPLRKGVIFGVHYTVNTQPAGIGLDVILKLYHPDGSHIWGETTIQTDQLWFNSYTVDRPEAHQPGMYAYVIEYQGQELVRIPFEFYEEKPSPPTFSNTPANPPSDPSSPKPKHNK